MRWLLFFTAAGLVISFCTASSFAQSVNTYSVVDPISGKSYPVNYNIMGATITDMSLDKNQTSLVLSLQTTSQGNLTITLPRTLIDAKTGVNDDQFIVLEDGADTGFSETTTSTDRTLSIPITDGTEKVEIIGTQVVPEFGSSWHIILAISLLSIVAISVKTRFKLKF
jgi:predicted secreted protein with PEFG-CTERM motif